MFLQWFFQSVVQILYYFLHQIPAHLDVKIDFDWMADSFSVLMPDYYSELSAGDQQDLVSCYLTLSLKMPKNWRMKITNVTYVFICSLASGDSQGCLMSA